MGHSEQDKSAIVKRIFKFLREDEARRIAEVAKYRSYRQGETIYSEGDECTGIYFLVKGVVQLQQMRDGLPIEVRRHTPGDYFGHMSFVEGQPASLTAVAAESVTVLALGNQAVAEVLRENPGFGGRFYQSLAEILSQNLRETSQLLSAQAPRRG